MLLLGQPLERLPELHGHGRYFADCPALFEALSPKELEDQFVLLHFTRAEDNETALRALISKGLSHDQILALPGALQESTEDLRLRISVQIELMRQRRLDDEISAATGNGALRFLHELRGGGETIALDRARYAHALACALQLGPARHKRSVRLALFYSLPGSPGWTETLHSVRHLWPVGALLEQKGALAAGHSNAAWHADIPLELLVAECAELAAANADSAIQFRDQFREKCAKLPFRLRADLRDAAERCFTHVWEADSRAA